MPHLNPAFLCAELETLGVTVDPGTLRADPLTHNTENLITGGLWRVRADGFDVDGFDADGLDAVLKVVVYEPGGTSHWQPSTNPEAWNFWRREADLYEQGSLVGLQTNVLRCPEPLGVVHRSETEIAIWLPYVNGRSGYTFTVEDAVSTGYELGRANGLWSVSQSALPPSASRRFLREYIGSKPFGWDAFESDESWSHPVIAQGFPSTLRADATRLHHEREWFLQLMEGLPRTLCHLDLWPNNVIVTNSTIVLVDYAFVGDGTFGEDIGNMVVDAVFDRFIPAHLLSEIATRTLESYLDGLHDAGWTGDDDLVRLGFYGSAIKYDWLCALMVSRAGDEQLDYGGTSPVEAGERYRERGLALHELMLWAEQARQLARRRPDLLPAGLNPSP